MSIEVSKIVLFGTVFAGVPGRRRIKHILIIALDSQVENGIIFARITIKLISGSCVLSSFGILPHENN